MEVRLGILLGFFSGSLILGLVYLLYLLIAYLRGFMVAPPAVLNYPERCAGCGAALKRTGSEIGDSGAVLCGACGVVTRSEGA